MAKNVKRTVLRMEVVVANDQSYADMENQLTKDLRNPQSLISKYLAQFNYRPVDVAVPMGYGDAKVTFHNNQVRISSPNLSGRWNHIELADLTKPKGAAVVKEES